MEAFSKRERRKIIRLYQSGWDTADIAQQFGASQSGVRRVWQQFREEGRDGPAFANCGRKPTLTDEQKQVLLAIIQEQPDRFVHEVAQELKNRIGVQACRQTVGRWLQGLGLTRKKSRCMPPNSSVRTSKSSVISGSTPSLRPAKATLAACSASMKPVP